MTCFAVKDPKPREIFASCFRDRIVHHALIRRLEYLWEPRFIHDSYACRKEKGTHRAVERLTRFMRRAQGGKYPKPGYYLQLDIANYFMTVDRALLFELLSRGVSRFAPARQRQDIMYLLRLLLFQDPTERPAFAGKRQWREAVPRKKSFFFAPAGKGIPIGNLTSQFFANAYLDQLDQYVKRTLRQKFYLRYMDDFVIIDKDRRRLTEVRDRIEEFLEARLKLRLKERTRPQPLADGVNFLGYIVRPRYRLARARVVGNLKNKLPCPLRPLLDPPANPRSLPKRLRVEPERLSALRQTLASYCGHFKHADSARLTLSFWRRFPALRFLFVPDIGRRRLVCLAAPASAASLRDQRQYFSRTYAFCLRFYEIGTHYELYDDQAVALSSRAKPAANRGGRLRFGFPKHRLSFYTRLCEENGMPYAIIGQNGFTAANGRYRQVVEIYTGDKTSLCRRQFADNFFRVNPDARRRPFLETYFLGETS